MQRAYPIGLTMSDFSPFIALYCRGRFSALARSRCARHLIWVRVSDYLVVVPRFPLYLYFSITLRGITQRLRMRLYSAVKYVQ